MRLKEEAHDYRYFPEPDLLPVVISDEQMERILARVPELPRDRRHRFCQEYGLNEYEASVLTDQKETADYFEDALASHRSPRGLANWIMNEVLREVKERGISPAQFEIGPVRLAGLVRLLDEGTINAQVARDIMHKMIETGKDAATLVAEEGVEQISDRGELEPLIERVIQDNPQPVEHYRAGKKQAVGALVGQVMRLTQGKADPRLVSEMLRRKLDETE
jgi:aspartyl-tRNA(Asn)/glutamyl-tRNA(Gln) amidotransferase subunit B